MSAQGLWILVKLGFECLFDAEPGFVRDALLRARLELPTYQVGSKGREEIEAIIEACEWLQSMGMS